MTTEARPTLGSFMNIVCFQYLRVCTEEVAGRAPIVAAGRKRGYDVVEGLGLLGAAQDPQTIQARLDGVLGAQGTRLCLIQSITTTPGGGYEVKITESACTSGQRSGEPLCAFTLGVFIGAISALSGQRMRGEETTCQACGDAICTYRIEPV